MIDDIRTAQRDREKLISWLRDACGQYELEPVAVYRAGRRSSFPISAHNEDDLQEQLKAGGHFLPLPKEPASLANVLEVSLTEFLLDRLSEFPDADCQRGTERGYPDLEINGPAFGDLPHAVDLKAARRRIGKSGDASINTQSRITLYTGNTYFRYPQLLWPGTFRPFQDYGSHISLIAIYTLNSESLSRIEDLDLIVHETWRIASKQRSSTTREYIGAMQRIDDIKNANGEFENEEDFYAFWRKFPFRIGRSVQQQLDRLLEDYAAPTDNRGNT